MLQVRFIVKKNQQRLAQQEAAELVSLLEPIRPCTVVCI